MKKFELFAASAIAVVLALPAAAQDAAPQPAPSAQSGNSQEPDIIVTATKREQTLLDTPVAVSVTSAQTIQQAQIRDLIDLQSVVPSLRVAQLQSSANTNFIIRGFGNGANNAGIEPSVGVFVDGVYRSRSAAQITDLPNLKRIEVLRGPQSTLFGKNASAGIISIVTAEPSFDFGGSAEASYGNYNAVVLKADITGPISETLAFSLAGNYNRRDGYVRDENLHQDVNNRNRYGFRGQLLFQPSSGVKFRLIADYDKVDENCCAVANIIDGPTGNVVRALGGKLDSQNPYSYRVYNNKLSTNNVKNYGVSLQGDFDLSKNLTLTSITSYRGVKLRTDQDSDFTSADLIATNANRTDIDTFTQELRIASNFDGPFNFLLGGFYFNEKIKVEDDLITGTQFRPYVSALISAQTGGAFNAASLETQLAPFGVRPGSFFAAGQGLFDKFKYRDHSFSIFGQADYEIVDGLTLTGGFNYTDDRKRVSSDVVSTDVFSALDFVQIGWASTLSGLGVNPANPASVGAFAQANPAAYAQIVAGSQNPATNPLLALRQLQFLPQFEQDAGQLFVSGLAEEIPFFMQNQMFGRVYQPLDVDSFLVQILQFGYFYLVRRFVFESIINIVLKVDNVPYRYTCQFLKGNLDIAYITFLARLDLFFQVVVHQFVQVLYVFLYGSSVDFLVCFQQQFEEIKESGIQFHKVSVLVYDFLFDEYF